jgi:hypothetical protein
MNTVKDQGNVANEWNGMRATGTGPWSRHPQSPPTQEWTDSTSTNKKGMDGGERAAKRVRLIDGAKMVRG